MDSTNAKNVAIKITQGLYKSYKDFKTLNVKTAVEIMDVLTDLYELTRDDSFNRVFGDIEVYATNEQEAKEWDGMFHRALSQLFRGLNERFALCNSTGEVQVPEGKTHGCFKVSWRFFMPDRHGSRAAVEAYVVNELEPVLLNNLKDEGLPASAGAKIDRSVYSNGRKMRMLKSSKDNEDRPLVLVDGNAIDTLITFIPSDCTELPEPVGGQEIKTKPKATMQAPVMHEERRLALSPDSGLQTVSDIHWKYLNALADEIVIKRIDSYRDCTRIIWALQREENSPRMTELIRKVCARSHKFKQSDATGCAGNAWVDKIMCQFQRCYKKPVTIASLVHWLNHDNKDAAAKLRKDFPQTFCEQLFVKTQMPPKQHVYDSRYCDPFPLDENDTVILQSALGTGKTFQIMGSKQHKIKGLLENTLSTTKGVLTKTKYPRVLFISGRKTFTAFALGELRAQGLPFHCYSDPSLTGSPLAKLNRLFIQVESLHRLKQEFEPYDLVIIDESETISNQLHSKTTNKDNLIHNHHMMEKVIQTARKCIAADAFVSDRTLSLMRLLRDPASTIYVENTHQPYNRVALELQGLENDKRIPNVAAFIRRIREAIETGRRIVIVWTSKKKGLAFETEFLQPLLESKGMKYKFYHGDNTAEERADLHDVQSAWATINVLMYTTTISVGISYNPAGDDPALRFDEIFLYGNAATSCPRDVAQSLLRCRKLNLDRLTYVIDERGGNIGGNWIRGRDVLRAVIDSKQQKLMQTHPLFQWPTCPEWAEENFVHNENEKRVSHVEYRMVLRRYLKLCGYAIELVDDKPIERHVLSFEAAKFHEIAEITNEVAEDIKKKIMVESATVMEKLQLKKHRFLSCLRESAHKRAGTHWDTFMESHEKEVLFWNMVNEKHLGTVEAIRQENAKYYLSMTTDQLQQRMVLDKVFAILGLAHSQDPKVFSASAWEQMAVPVKALEKDLLAAFHLRSSRKNTDVFDSKSLKNLINSVLKAWSGSTVKTCNGRKITRNGKRPRVYDYKIVSTKNEVYSDITERNALFGSCASGAFLTYAFRKVEDESECSDSEYGCSGDAEN